MPIIAYINNFLGHWLAYNYFVHVNFLQAQKTGLVANQCMTFKLNHIEAEIGSTMMVSSTDNLRPNLGLLHKILLRI